MASRDLDVTMTWTLSKRFRATVASHLTNREVRDLLDERDIDLLCQESSLALEAGGTIMVVQRLDEECLDVTLTNVDVTEVSHG